MITDKPLADTRPPSFALISPSGYGNLGDVAIVNTVIEQIRLRYPDARIIALTLNPADTLERHGVEAVTLCGIPRPHYWIVEPVVLHRNEGQSAPSVHSQPVVPAPSHTERPKVIRLLDRATRSLRRRLWPLKAEVLHIRRSWNLIKTIDTLVICGGGQLDDYWGGTWGHPYVLYRWSMLAKRVGAKIAVLGVGTGTLRTVLSRLFVRQFLSNADFRSYRDTGSRDLVGAPNLTQGDTVGPDLAFALNLEPYPLTKNSTGDKLHVAVSPMTWLDPRNWPEKSQARYDRYIRLLADVVTTLVRSGRRVSLFATDDCDEMAIADVIAVMQHNSPAETGLVELPAIGSVNNLLILFSKADLVIASRLHGTLLSCLMAVPTVALSYDRKVTMLMDDLNLSAYCRDVSDVDLSAVTALINNALDNKELITKELQLRVAENRRLLDAQFDTVFGQAPVRDELRV